MASKLFVLGAILLIGIATESSAQYWNQRYSNRQYYPQQSYPQYQQPRPNYQQSNGYQQTDSFQLPPGVSVANTEWVCKNPKTGDMMIIATEDEPASNTGGNNQGQWQQPSYPQVNPTQPSYPHVNPNQPSYPQVNPTQPSQPSYPTENKPSYPTTTPNTNGDGLIDIRFGEK